MSLDLSLFPRQGKVLELVEEGANEILYGGAAGSAKSHLLRVLAILWSMRVPGIKVYLFRRLYKDLKLSHMIGSTSFPALLRPLIDNKLVTINHSSGQIIFDNESRIILSHCQYENDLDDYLSQEINILLMDEGSTFTEKMYKFLRSRVRLGGLQVPKEFFGMVPFIIIATNPRGALHSYLKRTFVDVADGDKPFIAPEDDGGMTRAFVAARITDNYMLMENDPQYINRLKGMLTPELVKAYLEGDWSIPEDQGIPEFDKKHNVIKDFKIPFTWKIKRCYDYGYSAPYSVLWLAKANGESVLLDNEEEFCPPKGSIIVCGEIYGDLNGTEVGLKEQVEETAKKITKFEREKLWNVLKGPADSAIFNKEQGPSIASKFEDEGVRFKRANKRPGSRINGLSVIRQMFWSARQQPVEKPALYITASCKRLIQHIPQLTRDQKDVEDIDTECNDHDFDTLRYGVLDITAEVRQQKISGF